jgi:hypothetical protein
MVISMLFIKYKKVFKNTLLSKLEPGEKLNIRFWSVNDWFANFGGFGLNTAIYHDEDIQAPADTKEHDYYAFYPDLPKRSNLTTGSNTILIPNFDAGKIWHIFFQPRLFSRILLM